MWLADIKNPEMAQRTKSNIAVAKILKSTSDMPDAELVDLFLQEVAILNFFRGVENIAQV